MNLINTCRNISLHSEEILFNWQQEILYRFAIDWRCPFLDAIASPSTYPCQSVSEWVSQCTMGPLQWEDDNKNLFHFLEET